MATHPPADNSTFGNTDFLSTAHMHLEMTFDFDIQSITGIATHDLIVHKPTSVLQLDCWDIEVTKVRMLKPGDAMKMRNMTTDVAAVRKLYQAESAVTLDYRVRTFNEKIGQTLIMDLGQQVQAGESVSVAVWY